MKIELLSPIPKTKVQFSWSCHRMVPDESGCYAITSYAGEILYVGLAKKSIRSRMGKHLDTPEKREVQKLGAAYWFFYILADAKEVNKIERGWMNQSILNDGKKPILNKIYSPL